MSLNSTEDFTKVVFFPHTMENPKDYINLASLLTYNLFKNLFKQAPFAYLIFPIILYLTCSKALLTFKSPTPFRKKISSETKQQTSRRKQNNNQIQPMSRIMNSWKSKVPPPPKATPPQ